MGRNQVLLQIRRPMSVAVTCLTLAHPTAALAKPNSKVLAAGKACEPSARSLLQRLVQIDSGTGDVAGLAAMGAILKTELDGLGASVTGTPSIDGFGMRGGGAHGVDDYADLSRITPRVYLLTRMLMDLGRNPRAKSPVPSSAGP